MKKIISLVLALAMILMVGSVYAADTNNLTNDPSIKITGLEQGDQVTLYQVLEWGANGYWTATADYAAVLDQAKVDDLVGQNHESGQPIANNGGLSAYIDTIIAVKSATAVDGPTAVGSNGEYTYASSDAGMYYAVVTPKNGTRIYKPIFISSDYNPDNTSKTLAVTNAKYETVTLDKESISQTDDQDSEATYANGADSDNTVGVGDIVEFTLTTTIPKFPASFEHPIFKVSDSLRYLELVANSGAKDIRVYSPTYDPTAKTTNLVAASNYTLTSNDSASFTVAFSEAYIASNANKQVVVVYTAKVLNEGDNIIDNSDNTAKVNFSNNPDDEVGANEVEDHTEHYSFTLNGEVWGEYHSTDIVKVGINDDGTEITQDVEVPNGHFIGALQGAKFSLYESDAEGKKTNNIYKDFNKNIVSGSDGRFTISNLDAGTYYLVEEEAPAGYIKQQTPVRIDIIPTFATHTVDPQTKTVHYDLDDDSKTVEVTVPGYTYPELASYKILVDNVETATYKFKNDAKTERGDDKIGETVSGGDSNPDNDNTGKVKNPKGVELPSTGGIGTTIFYILGGLLVVGAAVILVARRKAQD